MQQNSATAIARRAFMSFFRIPDAQIFPLVPPSVPELGFATGFDLQMEDRANLGHAGLIQARNMLLGLAARDPLLAGVRPASLDDTQQLHISIDQEKANALGVATADINSTLSAAWGGSFVNNFIDHDRVKRVYMQGDAPYRMAPEDLNRWYVRTSTGTHGALLVLRDRQLGAGTGDPYPLQRPALDRNAGPRCARRQFRHRAGGNGQAVQATAARHRL